MTVFISLYVIFLQSIILRFYSNNLGREGSIQFIKFNFLVLMSINYWFFIAEILAQKIPYQYIINLGCWFHFDDLNVNWLFSIDSLSFTMSLLVITISCFVHIYSIAYLENDPYLIKFMSYLSLSTSFMLLMVLSLNLLVFFVGWEGIGLCSYLLISFWYTRIQALKAALKAILINRIGDFFFLLGLCFCFRYLKTIDIDLIILFIPYYTSVKITLFAKTQVYFISFVAFCFSMAAIGKSAQLGLHVWLPDAMEGPTPVSALIHAATMVTAGIYLLLRLSNLLVFAPTVLTFLVVSGALTAFTCSLIATVQFDIKKIIAYSTCSQLGYMFLAIGTTNFVGSYYHLINHAFFKALLFLTAGAIIHSLSGEQDIRKMGGLVHILPFYYFCFLIGSLSMVGFFFFSGYYSKEFIINSLGFMATTPLLLFSYWLSIMTTTLTAFYSFRLIYEVFFGTFKGYRRIWYELLYSFRISPYFKYTLLLLLLLSMFSGYLLKSLFLNNSLFFSDFIPIVSNHMLAEYVPYWVRLVPVIASLIGFILFVFYYDLFYWTLEHNKVLYATILEGFFFSSIINWLGYKILLSTRTLFYLFDKGLLEVFGPSGIYYTTKYLSIAMLRQYYYEHVFYQVAVLCFDFLILLIVLTLIF